MACFKKEGFANDYSQAIIYLIQNNKYYSMFKDYTICISLKNDVSINNLIVRTKF